MTRQRKLILDIVNQSCEHPTAEEIFIEARKRMPGIALATVYNNLNALTEQKLIRRVGVHGGADCYDRTQIEHEHIICERCGAIEDVQIRNFVSDIERQTGEIVTGYELTLKHICKMCRGN